MPGFRSGLGYGAGSANTASVLRVSSWPHDETLLNLSAIGLYGYPLPDGTNGASWDFLSIALPKGRLVVKLVRASDQNSQLNPG